MLLVTGLVDETAFLASLTAADERLSATADSRPPPRPERPWSGPVPPMVTTAGAESPVTVSFPSDDESVGTVRPPVNACLHMDMDMECRGGGEVTSGRHVTAM